ncbi:sensor domain-containing diguanylate cyclase [Desulfonatronovibrio magnus]|uniref:sensor domain-containing diguanylate cyclase n=1 Tax=Desulfonatronovibrio magnus TaxID=698827 RepID=UPI0005EBCFFC|nr:sensor domain-containing diguanylate cyclase [Desulfonatronovibrio magnus]
MIKKYWIIFVIVSLLLGAFATTMLTSYFVAYRALGEEIRNNTLPLTGDNIYSEIQKDLMLSIHISSLMAHDTFVWDWILDGENEPERMISYLSQIREKYDTVTSFFVSDQTLNYYHPDGILKQVSQDDPQDEWYFRSRNMVSPFEINIDTDTADQTRLTIFINYKVYGYDDQLLGVTGAGLELNQVRHILNTYQEKYNSRVLFVNNSGIVILHADDFNLPGDITRWENFSSHTYEILTSTETSFRYDIEGRVNFVSTRYIPEFDLFLIILKDNDEVYERLLDRLKFNFIIGLLITLIVATVVSLVLKKYYRNLERLVRYDVLTGALNRSAFSLIFSHKVKEKKRGLSSLSLVLIDIDDFKSINDYYGHQTGDEALKAFSETVLNLIREVDAWCRWGGEEFVLLLGGCSAVQAEAVIEKIRQSTSKLYVQSGSHSLKLSFSAGVVEHREGEDLEHLVERADKLMYQAKKQGKNLTLLESDG